MLVHPWDAALDDDEWRTWLQDNDFGTLIAAGRGRDVPVAVPTHFTYEHPHVLLHLARPNPVWPPIEENPRVLLSVVGDVAYVPSAWKAVGDEDPALGIPTSYYAAVLLTCTATVLTGDELAEVLRVQLADFEPGSGVADPGVAHRRRLSGIRGLRLQVDEVRAKFKYGGNADAPHRAAVADRLAERSRPGDAAARAHLLRRTPLTD